MRFKRLLWTPMLSKSKNGLVLARLYQALCYYVSSIEENDYIFDELSNRWIEIADDVYYKLTLIDRGLIADVSDEYLNEIQSHLNMKSKNETEQLELEQLRVHIMKLVRGENYNQMPVYVK